jgi:hypothetical protein
MSVNQFLSELLASIQVLVLVAISGSFRLLVGLAFGNFVVFDDSCVFGSCRNPFASFSGIAKCENSDMRNLFD